MAMNILNELKFYCNEKEPAGALMLTGEWGCGKTYLIDHTLSEALKGSHIFVRISLFGISSTDAVTTAVKQAWIEAVLDDKGTIGTWMKNISHVKEAVATVAGAINDTVGTVLSLDISKIASISKTIGEKTVVLVFDDLERCRIDTVDLLGIINDYCENQKFHTIIITNEDYMLQQAGCMSVPEKNTDNSVKETQDGSPYTKTTAKNLSYKEIKEKIVQRTVKMEPDYNSVIQSVIDKYETDDEEYKRFLVSQTEGLQNLFDVGIPMSDIDFNVADIDSETLAEVQRAHNPHNIRSFRCAIQDFHRVFMLLKMHGITVSLDKWLFTFVMFTMAHKAGAVTDCKAYGDLFTDVGVSQLYPFFYNDTYMLWFEKMWVLRGEWDEELAANQIEKLKDRQNAATPYDIVRTYQLKYMDEEVFYEGFPQLLNSAYSGDLAIEDYIQLILNTASAREYQLELPAPIDWNKVKTGVQKKFESIIQQGEEDTLYRKLLSDKNVSSLTEEERSIYVLIEQFRKDDKLTFAKSKKEFLDLIEKDPVSALSKLKNKRLNCFDEEMARSVVRAFEKCHNNQKPSLLHEFEEMWQLNVQSPDIDIEKTKKGFSYLKNVLLEAKKSVDKTKVITLSHFDDFVATVERFSTIMETRGANTENI